MVVQLLLVEAFEGEAADRAAVQADGGRPDIRGLVGVRHPLDYLGAQVDRRSADTDLVALLEVERQPEVDELHLRRGVHDDVVELDVAVDNLALVAVPQRLEDLPEGDAGVWVSGAYAFRRACRLWSL